MTVVRPKATEFPRQTLSKSRPGFPCFTGYAAVIGTQEGFQVIVMAAKKKDVVGVCKTLAPNLELDMQAVYPVALLHRTAIVTTEDEEEL